MAEKRSGSQRRIRGNETFFFFLRMREIRQYKWGKGTEPVEGKRLKMKRKVIYGGMILKDMGGK